MRTQEETFTDERYAYELGEWDWYYTMYGMVLHHAAEFDLADGETSGDGVTSCGRKTFLMIPGIFSRMGLPRCKRCCAALGYPQGTGSPKNDDACRPLVEARLANSLALSESDHDS